MLDTRRGGRDYSLLGPEAARAVEKGLAGASWYKAAVPRKTMKELMRREDARAVRDTVIWLGLLVACGVGAVLAWGTWWCVPFFIGYGLLYGTASDSRWHEAGHGTAFKSRWLDQTVYQIACFMIMRDPTVSRWSHTRHHTDTLIVGHDPEIVAMRPPRLIKILLNLLGLVDVPVAFGHLFLHAAGRLDAEEATYVPDPERRKVARTARIWLLIYLATVAACVLTGSLLPALLVGLPRMYGAFGGMVYSLTQHAGLGEDLLDHRLIARTVKMGRVNRFLYWNMNYHVEHHMFPMVPYHALPALHEIMKDDCPPAYPSIWAAYREIIPTVLRQLRDPGHFVYRQLPAGAVQHPLRDQVPTHATELPAHLQPAASGTEGLNA